MDHDFEIFFKEPVQEDMLILEKWYGMTDYFGYATGLKDFSQIAPMLKSSDNINSISFMIHKQNDKTPVGFVYGHVNGLEHDTVLWIRILIVAPSFQNRGIGTRAINKLLNYAKLKHRSLTCVVAVSNQNRKGLSFWEKAGFLHSPELEESLLEVRTSKVSIMKKVIK